MSDRNSAATGKENLSRRLALFHNEGWGNVHKGSGAGFIPLSLFPSQREGRRGGRKKRGRRRSTVLELNRLYNLDCMQGMKEFPDGFFDLAIVDPPYGIGIDGQRKRVCRNPKHNRKEHSREGWDNKPPTEEYFRELERVSREQIIWGGNYFVPMLKQAHKGWLVWDKGQRGLSMSDCELAYTSFDTPTRIFTLNRVELQIEGTIHPTQKPVKLYEWVLSLFARKGMKILDTHAGSASSLVACQRIGGLDYVGFEINTKYFEAANRRLEEEKAQIRLFDLLEEQEKATQTTLF
nr:MAG: DNA methylase [Bacteriophage sp.]UVY16057.1 MAG: DNA methylase [Bacteriophage sp.]UVY66513.1 MAG: DNA methylase [Bacteriophage sp.]